MGSKATVRDHLKVHGDLPSWIFVLGENIQKITNCSAAIAASRARDLSRLNGIGKAIEGMTTGWIILQDSDTASLSSNQRETIRQVVENILNDIQKHVKIQEDMK